MNEINEFEGLLNEYEYAIKRKTAFDNAPSWLIRDYIGEGYYNAEKDMYLCARRHVLEFVEKMTKSNTHTPTRKEIWEFLKSQYEDDDGGAE